MKSTYTRVFAKTAAVAFVLLTQAFGSAIAKGAGSTDIYLNEFASSFGAEPNGSIHPSVAWNGSTDIYANAFQVSFGAPDKLAGRPAQSCGIGSTDIYRNEFARSFALAPASTQAQIQLCEGGTRPIR